MNSELSRPDAKRNCSLQEEQEEEAEEGEEEGKTKTTEARLLLPPFLDCDVVAFSAREKEAAGGGRL